MLGAPRRSGGCCSKDFSQDSVLVPTNEMREGGPENATHAL